MPAATADLYVSPFRKDDTTDGTPIRTWALVVDRKVQVRAADGPKAVLARISPR